MFIAIAFTACGTNENPVSKFNKTPGTTIYFSRHAEKAGGKDLGLLPAGEQRAQQLARRFGDQSIAAVYATGYRRTQATAAPVAKAAGVLVKTYSATAAPATVTKRWLNKHRGETIFVVGHSNTMPGLVNALVPSAKYGDIDENDYDRLFRVKVSGDGEASVQELSSALR